MTRLSRFPDPQYADETGLLCYGGDLEVETLLDAYSHGIFPWPHEGYPLLWFSPPERGVLVFEKLHISKRLTREMKKVPYRFTWNQNFYGVVTGCSRLPRKGQDGTWINSEMLNAYVQLHKAGYAHSLECWDHETLIGGLYGVGVYGVFSGESMFGLKSNVSKMCLIRCVEHLASLGLYWMDTQMVTPVVENLGGTLIERQEFLKWLRESHMRRGSVDFSGIRELRS